MKRLLVTGADGFAGRWLVRAARGAGRQVIAAIHPASTPPAEWTAAPEIETIAADLTRQDDVLRLGSVECDAVVHLAAVASGAAARRDSDLAMAVNARATAELAIHFARRHAPRFLLVSTGEVYGAGHLEPIPESAPRAPCSPYAESKAAAEDAVVEVGRSTGMWTIIARAFPHSGPGQSTAFVLPALASRLRAARRNGDATIRAGNLGAIRDFLDVRDVVRGYLLLVEHGVDGEVYNVASGVGRRLADCLAMLSSLVGVNVRVEEDPALLRPADIPVLIGDARRLRSATGWSPRFSFEQTLQDLVDAQTD